MRGHMWLNKVASVLGPLKKIVHICVQCTQFGRGSNVPSSHYQTKSFSQFYRQLKRFRQNN